MLTTVSTLKSRLGIPPDDATLDDLLANAIKAISARFDNRTNRTLARTNAATHEFPADDAEISPVCYPIESVTKFETKSSETEGWVEQTNTGDLIRGGCIISLPSSLILHPSSFPTAFPSFRA
jgi:hypothetical protein